MSRRLIHIHECLSDETRLRMMALLLDGSLCVCHFQSILKIPQVKASRHLAYLREHGLVEVTKNANWRIYRLPEEPDPFLLCQLACLRENAEHVPQIRRDRTARRRIESEIESATLCCD